MAPLLGPLASAITASLGAAVAAAAQQRAALQQLLAGPSGQQGQRQPSVKGMAPDQVAEATSAAALLALIVHLSEQAGGGQQGGQQGELPAELQPAAKAAAQVAAADYGGGVVRLPSMGLGLVEACLEVWTGAAAAGAGAGCSAWCVVRRSRRRGVGI